MRALFFLSKILKSISDFCCNISKIILISFMFGISFSIVMQVFFRYVLGHALIWPEDASKYMMIWVAYFGSGIAIREKGHVALTLFVSKFPEKLRFVSFLLGNLIILGFSVIFIRYGFTMAIKNPGFSWNLGISYKWPMLGLPIAGLFMTFHILYIIVHQLITKEVNFGGDFFEIGDEIKNEKGMVNT